MCMVKISQSIANKLIKRHKYGAKKTVCLYGHKHDSQKEAMWCLRLHEEQKEGKIERLRVEPSYEIIVNDVVVCKHLVDFDYYRINNKGMTLEVTDVKGMKLPMWRLKYKLFCALYPQIEYKVV